MCRARSRPRCRDVDGYSSASAIECDCVKAESSKISSQKNDWQKAKQQTKAKLTKSTKPSLPCHIKQAHNLEGNLYYFLRPKMDLHNCISHISHPN